MSIKNVIINKKIFKEALAILPDRFKRFPKKVGIIISTQGGETTILRDSPTPNARKNHFIEIDCDRNLYATGEVHSLELLKEGFVCLT